MPLALCMPQPEQPSHHAVGRGGSDLEQPVCHQAPSVCLGSTAGAHGTAGGMTSSHPTLAGGIPVGPSLGTRDSCPVVTAPGVHPHGCNRVHPKISERVAESGWF